MNRGTYHWRQTYVSETSICENIQNKQIIYIYKLYTYILSYRIFNKVCGIEFMFVYFNSYFYDFFLDI